MPNTTRPNKTHCDDITAIPYNPSSVNFFKKISTLDLAIWLDSGKPQSQSGRFDILSACPKAVFNYNVGDNAFAFIGSLNDYFEQQKTHLPDTSSLPDNPFCGGLIGCLDYDFLHNRFGLNKNKTSESSTQVGFYEWALVQDHKLKTCHVIFLRNIPQAKRHALLTFFQSGCQHNAALFNTHYHVSQWQHDQSKLHYMSNLAAINTYIHQGDTYQVNYTQRFSNILKGNPAAAYLSLRQAVPSPFSAYIQLNQHHILSVSPEQFVGVQVQATASNIQPRYSAKTQPIKGTVKRSSNSIVDQKRAKDLQDSIKNRSENVMIVDLLRNDFSQNCIANSVKTPKLFSLESYANVHHLVSTVTGILKPNVCALQFMVDCFPGGSITGAPKKRAMEIIDELEPHARQAYCGSVFYQSLCGQLDSNIAIRTMLYNNKSKKLYCWGGGGIVADSKKEDEYQESIDKVQALMSSLDSTSNN